MRKWIHSLVIMCIVISMTMCPFLFAFAVNNSLSGTAYSSAYIPACPEYPTINQCPYGEDTYVFFYEGLYFYYWYFYKPLNYVNVVTGSSDLYSMLNESYVIPDWFSFYLTPYSSDHARSVLHINSASPIIQVSVQKSNNTLSTSKLGSHTSGSYSDNIMTVETSYYYTYSATLASIPSNVLAYVSTVPYTMSGVSLDSLHDLNSSSFPYSDYVTPYYIAQYPDTVKQAIDSLDDYAGLMSQYYTTLNSKLNSLSIDVSVVQGQNSQLQSQVSELQSQLSEQGSEYHSALNQAQSDIESNAQSAAQSAADDINNAGEDVSDLDNDMDDVNSIVETLDGWIDDLDDFADRIDDSIVGVSTALSNANDVINGFFGICPPIVLAFFAFALVFLVVRKIIGR